MTSSYRALEPDRRVLTSPCGEEWEEIACPVCGDRRSELWLAAQDRLFGAPDTYRIVQCATCSLRFVNPRPTFAALGKHYESQYLCFVTPDELPALLRPILENMGRDNFVRRLKAMESVGGPITASTEILDVGCGLNGFLHYIQRTRGALGTGIDLNAKAIAYIRDHLKMPALEGTLESAKLESGRFDIVTMLQYLEHEGNPRQVLAEVRRVLRAGGQLVIEIPDPSGWPARVFKGRWAGLDLPRHLVYFQERTLRRALESEGFDLVSYQTFGLPFWTGISVYFSMQRQNEVPNQIAAMLASGLLGLPLLPLLPWTHEFALAIAKAR